MSTSGRAQGPSLGLRARVTVAFALGAFALSATLAGLTYGLVRNALVDQREESSASQAFLNARVVRDALRSQGAEVGRVIGSLETPGPGGIVVHRGDLWFSNSLVLGRDSLPEELRVRVEGGTAAQQRFELGGDPWLAVGVPIPRIDGEFYEAFSLADIDRTLSILSYSLAGAALATTVAGAAVGRWASGRVLRPLRSVSSAAAAIAGGQLDIRLQAPTDRDLAPLASSFNRMVDALAERIQRDARFASDVSHELRSPLTTLATSLDVLRARRAELSERAQSALDLLDADVRRFQRMVEDLLEISRFDAGVADLQLSEVDVGELVRHAVRDPAVPVEVEPAVAGSTVVVDKRRVDRVIANLLENAEAYGGGAARVEVGGRNGSIRIAVEDRGPGVPAEERAKVFERFFRGSAAGRRGAGNGSGLGLALVAEHVRLHGGRVWVEDPPAGRGARFVVEIPAAREDGAA